MAVGHLWLAALFLLFFSTMPQQHPAVAYEFGPFRLEPKERRLVREGRAVSLTGKALDTLTILVERHGTLVSKQELMDILWPDITVEENNLDRNISTLRKILGDTASEPTFIETVPRSGYRFVAPVHEVTPSLNPALAEIPPQPSQRQDIRFCITPDNLRIAYSTIGSGYPIVKVANCFNHLDFEWESPTWRHWVRDWGQHHSLVRYDARGNGLSQWEVPDFAFDYWVSDLETVVESAGLDRFALMGSSQGGATAIAYAARHPERVSYLVLCGAYSRGTTYRGRPEAVQVRRALESLIQVNWGNSNPSFFELVTKLYIPENATVEDMQFFNELQRVSISPGNLTKIMQMCDDINVRPLLPSISVPTIIFHSDRDKVSPPEEGRILAAEIPGAKFVPLPSGNHYLLGNEPAWRTFCQELNSFLKIRGKSAESAAS
jgi:DNA-binding winged helix-turn-helix (wHTH) protein/pimeloyl-ACP methyl ester carboxylesterase